MAAPSGYSSLGLIGFTDKGAYNSNANYMKNDLCDYGTKKWCSKTDNNQGHTPAVGTYWRVFIDTDVLEGEIDEIKQTLSDVSTARSKNGAKNLFRLYGKSWNASGQLVDTGTAIATEKIPVKPGQNFMAYKKTALASGSNMMLRKFDSNGDFVGSDSILGYASTTVSNYTIPSGVYFVAVVQFLDAGIPPTKATINQYEIMFAYKEANTDFETPCLTNKELTEKIKNLAYTTTNHGLTAGAKFSINSCVKTVVGNLVNYMIVGSVTEAMTGNDVIVSGLENPALTFNSIINTTFYDDTNIPYLAYSNTTENKLLATGTIPSGVFIRTNLTYAFKE